MVNLKIYLFARWLASCYSDAQSVLNRETGDWYMEQLKHFNDVIYPNYIENGTIESANRYFNDQAPSLFTNERFFLCDCNSEALLLTRFVDEYSKEIQLSIYRYGQFQKKPNIWDRLKYCWYHLKTGKKYEDQIIINFEKAQQISEWLSLNAY